MTGARALAILTAGALAGCIAAPPDVIPNDNRVAAGIQGDSLYDVTLVARVARWRPDSAADSSVTVQAFAAADGVPRIPGPLLRVAEGRLVRVTVANEIGQGALVVHGLQGSAGTDSLVVLPGERRELRFTAGSPGTYLYWATTTGKAFGERLGRDAQLTGVLVVDAAASAPDPAERIFVITTLDVLPDSTVPAERRDDLFDQAINGLSWPFTEVIRASTGDRVKWRWVNGGYLPHPMHLHGYHFRVLAKGNGVADTAYAPGTERLAVTELMRAGSTFRMDFVPTRAGQWLFHCHMSAHIVPFPERPDSVRAHELHDAAQHPRNAMSGLVMGVHVTRRPGIVQHPQTPLPKSRHRLFAQEVRGDSGQLERRGFVLMRGAEPRRDSVVIPGTPLLLRRGERTAITVVNRLSQPTSVHWHGMELDPYYDGVAGWSGAGTRLSPMIAPGDSFTVEFTPPRAGTFIYHSHLEEEPQLHYGMYGAMLVLEPGERYDASSELLFVIGDLTTRGDTEEAVNGTATPPPITLRRGRTYRMRIINIIATEPQVITFRTDTTPLRWIPIAKDGAALPSSRRESSRARFLSGVGETYDFLWMSARRMDAELLLHRGLPGGDTIRVPIRVRP